MTFDCVWPLSQGSGWCSFAVKIRERKVPFHFRPPGLQTCPARGYTLDILGRGVFNVLSFWFKPGLKTLRSVFVSCVIDPGSLCGSEREQTKIRTITLWYLLSVAHACGAANYGLKWLPAGDVKTRLKDHGLKDWDQSTDSLRVKNVWLWTQCCVVLSDCLVEFKSQ